MHAAVRSFTCALEREHGSAGSHSQLGFAHQQRGELARAAECYRRAIAINPNLPATHNNLGACLFDQGNVTEAVCCYQRAIALHPQLAAAHYNLGNALQIQQQFEQAIGCYEVALRIDPNYGDAHANLGAALFAVRQLDLAHGHLTKALEFLPASPVVRNNLGAILHEQGAVLSAIQMYRDAIRLQPDYVAAIANLCDALVDQKAFQEAAESYENLIRFMPDSAEVHNNLGVAQQRCGRIEEAIRSYEQALQLKPDYPTALSNLGNAYWETIELPRAEQAFRQAILLEQDLAEAHVGLAKVLDDMGRYDEGIERFNLAAQLSPNNPEIRFARSLALLRLGDYERGWTEYEWRWNTSQFCVRELPCPQWKGEPLLGRTVLVHAEQGLGDTLQFVRYLRLVKAAGGQVIFAADRRLERILCGVAGIDRFVALGTPLPPFDLHVPLLSLPGIFESSLSTIPAEVPYLAADQQLVADMRFRLQPFRGLKVGVCWQGNPGNRRDSARSIPFSYIQQLSKTDGVTVISLQQSLPSTQLTADCTDQIVEITGSLDAAAGAFMETAAIIMNLDLVISCDTAVAHLAGALGRPVWLALGQAPDWRWLRDRVDSPWYPTMRIFRQTAMGNWADVFAAICTALLNLVPTSRQRSED